MSLEDTISYVLRENARDLISGNLDDVCRKIAGAVRTTTTSALLELEAIDRMLDRCPALMTILGRSSRIQRLVEIANEPGTAASMDEQAKELIAVDAAINRYAELDHSCGRVARILHLVERAEEADRFEKQWREVLKAEQDGSDSYVRIRETIGALDVPRDWTPLLESSTQDKVWSYTEYQAQRLVERLGVLEDRIRNARMILNEPAL